MSRTSNKYFDTEQCPRCKSRRVEVHDEPGDIPYYECLDCGICWDGSETPENVVRPYGDIQR